MKLHDLAPPKGATKAKQRVGRGTGGKGHKTAGRGTKGQHARNTVPAGFEGGQLPLMQRIPKLKGFKNPFRVAYTPVNIGALAALRADEITIQTMIEGGLCRPKDLVKVLGQGALGRPIRVTAHAFSASAAAAITTAGGSVQKMPLPFGNGRPPASGNALMNR
jgi:large subunit ribosomal protein L15